MIGLFAGAPGAAPSGKAGGGSSQSTAAGFGATLLEAVTAAVPGAGTDAPAATATPATADEIFAALTSGFAGTDAPTVVEGDLASGDDTAVETDVETDATPAVSAAASTPTDVLPAGSALVPVGAPVAATAAVVPVAVQPTIEDGTPVAAPTPGAVVAAAGPVGAAAVATTAVAATVSAAVPRAAGSTAGTTSPATAPSAAGATTTADADPSASLASAAAPAATPASATALPSTAAATLAPTAAPAAGTAPAATGLAAAAASALAAAVTDSVPAAAAGAASGVAAGETATADLPALPKDAPVAAPIVFAPAANSSTTAVTGAAASAPLPTQPAPLHTQVAGPIFTLAAAGNGEHVMTVDIVPDNLGPITVRAHVGAEGVRVELFAPSDLAREALRAILPDIRKDMGGAGLGSNLDLSSQNQPTDSGARDHQQRRQPQGESLAALDTQTNGAKPWLLTDPSTTIDVMA